MKHTQINRTSFDSALAALPIFSEAGGKLGDIRGHYRFGLARPEFLPKGINYVIERLSSQGAPIGHSQIIVTFSASDGWSTLWQPRARIMLSVVEIDSFTPRPLLGPKPPDQESMFFGSNRVGDDMAAQMDSAGHETLIFRFALEEILRAIERAVALPET